MSEEIGNTLRLLLPLASISFKLYPDAVGNDASKTTRHGVLSEVDFHTARHGMKFLRGLFRIIF